MKLTMLGTGNAMVTGCYNTCFLISETGNFLQESGCHNSTHFLVDGGGGNGILRQLKTAGIVVTDIHDIFVTHKHLDHLMGIIWIVRVICQMMSNGMYMGEARIYSHGEVLSIIREIAGKLLTSKQAGFIDEKLHLIEVKDGESLEIIGHKTTFFDIRSTKAKQFGFSMEIDKNRARLNSKRGECERRISSEKLTCCGDEPFNECERLYAENSKWLLHEAFCLYSEKEIFSPYEKHHSTVKEACEAAEQLRVDNLLLYHTEESHLTDRKKLYMEEGKHYYHGKLWIPDDLETIEL